MTEPELEEPELEEPELEEPERRWWFWPCQLLWVVLTPFVFPLLLIAAIISIPVEFILQIRQRCRETGYRARLAAEGRLLPWADVDVHLRNGTGTLIVEHCSPRGPVRDWWTEDDIIGNAPVSLPSAIAELPAESDLEKLLAYSRECRDRHLDEQNGLAKL